MNLSFDHEIQKMVLSEKSGTENFLISRSKSENQIGSSLIIFRLMNSIML